MLLLHQQRYGNRLPIRRRRYLAAVCREADILVAAIGRAAMVTKEFIRQGANYLCGHQLH